MRKQLVTALRHHNHVFVTRPAEARIIKTRLDREHLSILQCDFLQTRILVNLKPESMSGPVKKSDLAAFSHFRGIAALREKFLDRSVNFHPIHARLDSFQGQRLPGFHCLPKFSLPIARPSAHNRPSDVTKISRSP